MCLCFNFALFTKIELLSVILYQLELCCDEFLAEMLQSVVLFKWIIFRISQVFLQDLRI